MKIPPEAIEAASDLLDERTGRHTNRGLLLGGLEAAVPHLRAEWEKEQLEAMLSEKTIEEVVRIIETTSANQKLEHRDLSISKAHYLIAKAVVSYLTTPQILKTPPGKEIK